MPPSLSRSSLSSLSRCRPSSTSIPIRSFTTTPSLSSIGPENPKFIEIPQTVQPQLPPSVVVKGVLPPPRNLFPTRAGNKTSAAYLRKTAPPPRHEDEPANDFVAWKRRLAANRRKNLAEGLKELHARKKATDRAMADRSRTTQARNQERLHAPQREDERITNPTILESIRVKQTGAVPDPTRTVRLAEKAARVAEKERAKEEARRNALHTLYMHAREFIVTEQQLDNKIEEIFTETPHSPNNLDQNIWNVLQTPPSVQSMLSTVTRTQRHAVDFHVRPETVNGARLKKIAEELTGGKME